MSIQIIGINAGDNTIYRIDKKTGKTMRIRGCHVTEIKDEKQEKEEMRIKSRILYDYERMEITGTAKVSNYVGYSYIMVMIILP